MQWKKESERQFRQKEYIIFKQLTQRKAEKEKKNKTPANKMINQNTKQNTKRNAKRQQRPSCGKLIPKFTLKHSQHS